MSRFVCNAWIAAVFVTTAVVGVSADEPTDPSPLTRAIAATERLAERACECAGDAACLLELETAAIEAGVHHAYLESDDDERLTAASERVAACDEHVHERMQVAIDAYSELRAVRESGVGLAVELQMVCHTLERTGQLDDSEANDVDLCIDRLAAMRAEHACDDPSLECLGHGAP